MSTSIPATGGCICGGVRYQVSDRSKLRQVVACHCDQCRRFTGHFVAASGAKHQYFTFINDATLRWYSYLSNVRQGFCGECGCCLFVDYPKEARISILAGTLDDASGLEISAQIYCAEVGKYYQVPAEGEVIDGGEFSLPCPE